MLHLYIFSSLCINMYLSGHLFNDTDLSQRLHWYGLSPVFIARWLVRNVFLVKKSAHNKCIDVASHQCAISDVDQNHTSMRKSFYNSWIENVCHCNVSSYCYQDFSFSRNTCHIGYIERVSLQYVFYFEYTAVNLI